MGRSSKRFRTYIMSVNAHYDNNTHNKISERVQKELRADVQKGTLDFGYEPVRFGNTKELSMLEKFDKIDRLGMNALIFSSQFI